MADFASDLADLQAAIGDDGRDILAVVGSLADIRAQLKGGGGVTPDLLTQLDAQIAALREIHANLQALTAPTPAQVQEPR